MPLRPERARDHLANERTYLAWLRTALAVVALGAVVARLTATRDGRVTAASVITVTLGVLALAYGTSRYYTVARDLERDQFRPARRGPAVIALVAVVAIAVVLPLLLV